MDFQKIKEQAKELKQKAQKVSQDAMNYGASKIAASGVTLKTVEELEAFRKTSKNSVGKDSQTGEKKEFTHRSLVIFSDTQSDFFRSMLYKLPVLETKSFSQSDKFKLADINMPGLHKAAYEIHDAPCMVVFENEQILKVISGEENIQKVVKSPSLDINKTIDEL